MAKARKASVTQSKLMMIIYGKPFTGKSTLALQLSYFKRPDGKPFRVLYLDPESGSVDDYLGEFEANGVNLENIYIVYTQSLGEVRQYIGKVKNHEDFYELDDDGNETDNVLLDADGEPFRADAIVVDGTSILNLTTKQGLVEFSKKRNKVKAEKDGLIGDAKLVKIEGAGLELKDFQTVNFKGQDLILDLMASGVHCIVTAREAEEKQQVKLEDGTTTSVVTGELIPEGFKGMDYNCKTQIRTFREDGIVKAHIKKDRTHVHQDNEVIDDPTLLDWQIVIDRTADKEKFVIKNDLTKAVKVEQEIFKKEILGEVGNPAKDDKNEATNTEDDLNDELEALRQEIVATLKALSPEPKSKARKRLEDKKLPTSFKNVMDIAVLKTVLEVVKSN